MINTFDINKIKFLLRFMKDNNIYEYRHHMLLSYKNEMLLFPHKTPFYSFFMDFSLPNVDTVSLQLKFLQELFYRSNILRGDELSMFKRELKYDIQSIDSFLLIANGCNSENSLINYYKNMYKKFYNFEKNVSKNRY